jgi:uncharacterized membrane protein YuzA (DUF378 family)
MLRNPGAALTTSISTPNSIFTAVTLIASLGAISIALISVLNFNPIFYITGKATDLAEALYLLVGLCGICSGLVNVKLLIPIAKAKPEDTDNNKKVTRD